MMRKTTIELTEEQYFYLLDKALELKKKKQRASMGSLIRDLIEEDRQSFPDKEDLKEKILNVSISHWKDNFVGISALDISDKLQISHQKALEYIYILRNEGNGTLNEKVRLYPAYIEFYKDGQSRVVEDKRGVLTAIFFPSEHILKKQFEVENKDYGPFSNRLHTGDIQIKQYYFKPEVLTKYFNHQEKYSVDDDEIGGDILLKDDYYLSLPEDERCRISFGHIRYGKRKLADGSSAIAVMVHDLSRLSIKKQKYWESFEIDNPVFSEKDINFEKNIRQTFGAEFIDNKDPLKEIYQKMNAINQIFPNRQFFRYTNNPSLRYPTINTEKAYLDSHMELFKLIGPDSLNENSIEQILLETFGKAENDLIHKESKRTKGRITLFKMLFENLEKKDQKLIKDVWEIIQTSRIGSVHKIIEPSIQPKDYTIQFIDDCRLLLKALMLIEKELKRIHED